MTRWLDRLKRNVAAGIHVICAAVVVALVLSNLHVLDIAARIADDVRAEDERHLVRNEIDRQVEILAHDQSQISHWDRAVRALVHRLDWEFVRTEIADWLWEDFGIQTTIVVAPDGMPRVMVLEDEIRTQAEAEEYVKFAGDLIVAAREAYMERRLVRGDGYVVAGNPVRSRAPIFVSDVRMLDGGFNMIVAQAIVPDEDEVLPEGLPHVLLTLKPLTATMLTDIGMKLGLKDFGVQPAGSVPAYASRLPVGWAGGDRTFVVSWAPSYPASVIWAKALPLLAGVVLVAGLALGLVAVLYGRVLRRLQISEERSHFLAHHDALTGLPNRLRFDRTLEEMLARGEQDRCAVLCVDLDRFKAVNDTYGHAAGDMVIRTVAWRIASAVGERGMAARIGGDEFIILLRDGLERDAVLLLCDTIVESVCEEIPVDGGRASVGASIGVAWWPDDAVTAKSVIRSADEALYQAKKDGRGRTRLAGIPPARVPVAAGR
ncbi:diguanylate cyclase domain-containing protein [Stappia sp.]|uniref:diguanylate cyclase domain-containing protein n=1 Tax=Stappia sp. TaxID=1870903 RepID=UPI003D1443F9